MVPEYLSFYYKHSHRNLAYLKARPRYILPPHSPRQPVISDETTVCWGPIAELFYADLDLIVLLFAGEPSLLVSFSFASRHFFCGSFFCTYEHVVVEHLPQAHHSTAKQPRTKQQNKHVPIRVRQRKPTNKVREGQHVVEHFYSSQCSQNERRHRPLLGLQEKNAFVLVLVGALGIC